MTNTKRFYWIKLKTDFFSREDIDFLLSQKNGAEYVVLYQMLCLSTANNNGHLESKIGEVLVPYNAEKIVRDCKYFDIDTVNIAMALYKKLGLIYEEQDGGLTISNYEELVGSAVTDDHTRLLNAERQRRFRQKQKKITDVIVTDKKTLNHNVEYRDKSIDIRDKDNRYIDNKNNDGIPNGYQRYTQDMLGKDNIIVSNSTKCEKETKKFIKPTIEELKEYCTQENLINVDCEYFYNYYESNGWKVGKNPMKNWKATIKNWNRNSFNKSNNVDKGDESEWITPIKNK